MNRKLYALALMPILFFVGCANSEPRQEVVVETVKEIATEKIETLTKEAVKPLKETPKVVEQESSVSFITNKKVMEKGMLHIQTFMGSMKPTLKGLIESDSTHVTAMGACSSMAREMVDDYNKQINGVTLRRTALKYRNPKNKPDNADKMVMDEFLSRKTFKPLVVELPTEYRVYKALKIKPSCLLCHGARNDMSKELVKMIDRRYPKDRAVGFELGDFRGVVVAEIKK